MPLSTDALVLDSDAPIDLQTHTLYSDGVWTPEALLDHALNEQFGLIAITDHDRADTLVSLQRLAMDKGMPLLVAIEMTASWRGQMTDVLCYGFDPENSALHALAADVAHRQRENTRTVYDALMQQGCTFPDDRAGINAVLEKPSAQQPHALVAFLKENGCGTPERSAGRMAVDAGLAFMTTPIDVVVEAAHRGGGVSLIAHPGRDDGFVCYDAALLDELRSEVPIDGFEVYYPRHSAEQTAMFLEYAQKHDLLTSSGSDSHAPDNKPIKYEAHLSRKLLERLGIRVK